MQKLCESTSRPKGEYHKDFAADSQLLFDHILASLDVTTGRSVKTVKWRKDTWYQEGTSKTKYKESCSDISEEGSRKIYDWFVNNQRFIKEVKEKIVIVGEATVDEDREEEDDEEYFERWFHRD